MHEHRFGLVVGGVAERDGVGIALAGDAGQEVVADLARRLFQGCSVAGAVRLDVGAAGCERDGQGAEGLGYEEGVGRGGFAPEAVVEVGAVELEGRVVAEAVQGVEEGEGVGAA